LFDDLPGEIAWRARGWYSRLLLRRQQEHRRARRWERPILVGQARRLAHYTAEELSAWGRRMWATLGGHSVQKMYRATGRTGPRHPAVRAYKVSAARRKWRKQAEQEARRREELGLPPKARHKFLPLD